MSTRNGGEIVIVLEEGSVVSLLELAELSGLSRDAIEELAQAGVLRVTRDGGSDWAFDPRSVTLARRARRLAADFDLNDAGAVLALTLLSRIEALEARLHELECQLLK